MGAAAIKSYSLLPIVVIDAIRQPIFTHKEAQMRPSFES